MPQLRHSATGALLAEAIDPLDLVVVGAEVGLNRMMLDGVGADFDVAAARQAAAERAETANEEAAVARHENLVGPVSKAVQDVLEAVDTDPDPTPVRIDG